MPQTNPAHPNFPPTAAQRAGMRQAIELDQVANLAPADLPVSSATQSALDNKADLVGGIIPTAQIPAIAIRELLTPNPTNETEMLSLVGQKGDWCIRIDTGTNWVITGDDPSIIGNWAELTYPAAPLQSVNGQTGNPVLGKADVGLGNVPNVDATNTDNHVDGTTNKVFTATDESTLNQVAIDVTTLEATKLAISDADTLAELNSLITDATLIDTNDPRLSDARTPLAHSQPSSTISDSTAVGRSILTAATVAAIRTILELGSAALSNSGDFAAAAHNHTKSDLTDFNEADYATGAEGDLAVSALQPSDVINVLTSVATTVPLSAAQGKILKDLIDALSISDISGLQTALDGKAPTAHTHLASEIADFDTQVSSNAAVAANTAKVGITPQQASDIVTNNAKVGITTQQANDITANNAKLTANTANVTAAGALMDSEVTNLAQVKTFNAADYATAAQGAKADTALQPTTFNIQSGTTYTMVASDEGEIIEATNASSMTFTLIEFSAVGAAVQFKQSGDASPLVGTLPTGMTVSAADIAEFESITQGKGGTFICHDATPGAQVIKFI